MPIYNVHVYREMRLRFDDVEAAGPEEAAGKARDMHFDDAADWGDCEGESLAALVDLRGDEAFLESRVIDFEPGRLLKAAPALLEACRWMTRELCTAWDEPEAIPERFRAAIDSAEPSTRRNGGAGEPDAPSHPLLVAPGTPLQAGRLYLHLFHGRDDPDQEMDGWGFDGPVFGPLSAVQQTYSAHYRLYGVDERQEMWLACHQDMVVWDGRYYGDAAAFLAGLGKTA